MLLIAELNEEQDSSFNDPEHNKEKEKEKEEKRENIEMIERFPRSPPRPSSLNNSHIFGSNSPDQKLNNLVINVDEIESDHDKYHPMINTHSLNR